MIEFEIIICTYNRPVLLNRLVDQILDCKPLPSGIIVVDSSDDLNSEIQKKDLVTYLRSTHKNQPYQRYVGYIKSRCEVLIYLDDDLEIVDQSVLKDIIACYSAKNISGVSVGIEYEAVISSVVDNKIDANSGLFRLVNRISGVPKLKDGKIYIGGIAGKRPSVNGQVEWFSGPVMSFRRSEMHRIFDPELFDIFEQKLGVAEDKAISMRLGLSSNLWFLSHRYFRHPPVSSHYYSNVADFLRRVTYFRLYLSKVYVKLKGVPILIAYLHYIYFMLWRMGISTCQYAIHRKKTKLEILKGQALGFYQALVNRKLRSGFVNWDNHAKRDAAI